MKGTIIAIFMLLIIIITCFTTKFVSCQLQMSCDFGGSGDNTYNWHGLKSTGSLYDGRSSDDSHIANNKNNDENSVSFSTTTLWKKFQGLAIFSLYTPFVLSLAAGNLPNEAYNIYYNFQDYYFLIAYYKAYKICTIYTDVDQNIKEKCESSAKKYNSTADIPVDLRPETKSYMEFMLNTASGTLEELQNITLRQHTVPVFIITSITPCSRLYACLGKKVNETALTPNPYQSWIDENADPSTQNSTRKLESLVDGALANLMAEELDVVMKLYREGMRHEFEFFKSQLPKDQNIVIVPLSQKLVVQDHLKLNIYVDGNSILAGDTYVNSNYESLFQSQILNYAGDFSFNKKGGYLTEELLQTAKMSMEDIKNKVSATIGEVILQPYSLNFFEKVLHDKEINGQSIYICPSGQKEGTNVQANQVNDDYNKSINVFIGCSIDNWFDLINAKIGIVIGLNSDLKKKGEENGYSFKPWYKALVDIQSEYNPGSTLEWKPNVLYTLSSWSDIDASFMGYY